MITLVYVPRKHLQVADALSRAYTEDEANCGFIDDFEIMVHSVTQNFPGSSERLEHIKCSTADDATLQRLYQVVMKVRTRICETILEHAR